MAYAEGNPPTKKAFKQLVSSGKKVYLFSHSGIFPTTHDGEEFVEGPHYPQPHKWYAQVQVKDGIVISVK